MNYADGHSPVADYMLSQEHRKGRVVKAWLTPEELDHILNRRRVEEILSKEYESKNVGEANVNDESYGGCTAGLPCDSSTFDDYDYSTEDVEQKSPDRAGSGDKTILSLLSIVVFCIITMYMYVCLIIGWSFNPLEW